jgi:hypothetical protein
MNNPGGFMMEGLHAAETAEAMIACFGPRAAFEALSLAANAVMIGDLMGVMLWLEVRHQIHELSSRDHSRH